MNENEFNEFNELEELVRQCSDGIDHPAEVGRIRSMCRRAYNRIQRARNREYRNMTIHPETKAVCAFHKRRKTFHPLCVDAATKEKALRGGLLICACKMIAEIGGGDYDGLLAWFFGSLQVIFTDDGEANGRVPLEAIVALPLDERLVILSQLFRIDKQLQEGRGEDVRDINSFVGREVVLIGVLAPYLLFRIPTERYLDEILEKIEEDLMRPVDAGRKLRDRGFFLSKARYLASLILSTVHEVTFATE